MCDFGTIVADLLHQNTVKPTSKLDHHARQSIELLQCETFEFISQMVQAL